MPYIIGAASFALLIVCVVHAIRNDKIFPWIYIIVFLPGIGPVLYLAIEVVPGMISARQAGAMRRGVAKLADPNRNMRKAKREVEIVGSVDAKRKLADEYFAREQFEDARDLYRSALSGVHSDDPTLLYSLARTQFALGDGAGVQTSLDALQSANPKFVSGDAHLLYVRALELQDKNDEALDEYQKLVRYFAGEEARCRYALLLKNAGQTKRARAIFEEILKLTDGASSHYRRAQREWSDIARKYLAVPD
jgi:hypothetical protein